MVARSMKERVLFGCAWKNGMMVRKMCMYGFKGVSETHSSPSMHNMMGFTWSLSHLAKMFRVRVCVRKRKLRKAPAWNWDNGTNSENDNSPSQAKEGVKSPLLFFCIESGFKTAPPLTVPVACIVPDLEGRSGVNDRRRSRSTIDPIAFSRLGHQ